MKTKDPKELQWEIKSLGLAELSKFSSVLHLGKLALPFELMAPTQVAITQIECLLWTLLPMGLDSENPETFETQIKGTTEAFNNYVESVRIVAKQLKGKTQ